MLPCFYSCCMFSHTMYIDFEALGCFLVHGWVLHIWQFLGSPPQRIFITHSACVQKSSCYTSDTFICYCKSSHSFLFNSLRLRVPKSTNTLRWPDSWSLMVIAWVESPWKYIQCKCGPFHKHSSFASLFRPLASQLNITTWPVRKLYQPIQNDFCWFFTLVICL